MDPTLLSTECKDLLIHFFNVSTSSEQWEWIDQATESLGIPAEVPAARISELVGKGLLETRGRKAVVVTAMGRRAAKQLLAIGRSD